MLPRSTQNFEVALADVADLLADARDLEQRGNAGRAEFVYRLAEACALRSGFLELLRLVWCYTTAPSNRGRLTS